MGRVAGVAIAGSDQSPGVAPASEERSRARCPKSCPFRHIGQFASNNERLLAGRLLERCPAPWSAPRQLRRKALGSAAIGQVKQYVPAQNLSERIGEGPWLSQLDNVSVGHGASLRWRSGGVEHLHDTAPYAFMPSPTSAHSSGQQPLETSPLHQPERG